MELIARMEGITRQAVWNVLNKDRVKLTTKQVEQLRKFVLIRDGYQCQWEKTCEGKYNQLSLPERKKMMIVHHVDGRHKNHRANNMITLCKRCHATFHGSHTKKPKHRRDAAMRFFDKNPDYKSTI